MQVLLTFLALFPSTCVRVYEDELRYQFESERSLQTHSVMAQVLILQEGLPVTAEMEVWESEGFIHELALVVKPVPEEHLIA